MRRLVPVLGLLVACGGAPPPSRPAPSAEHAIVFRGGRVFDGERFVDADVLVVGARIAAVGPGVAAPAGAEVVDAHGATLLPGLIDGHTHAGEEERTLKTALVFGVTLEVDLFGPPERIGTSRADERAGRWTGMADLRGAGVLATVPGGHGTEYGIPIPTLTQPEEADAFVAARVAEGSDVLKIIYDHTEPSQPTLPIETVRALVVAAHARHLLVLAHIGSERDASDVVDAGVDGLAHLFVDVPAPAELVARIVARGVFVEPTLTVVSRGCGEGTGVDLATDPTLTVMLAPDQVRRLTRLRDYDRTQPGCFDNPAATMAALRAAHVPLVVGTDAINPGTAHGASVHGELALFVRAGLTPTEALAAATSVPARIFSLEGRGHVAPGMRADLVLCDGDVEHDIRATRRIRMVLKGGHAVTRAPVPPPLAPPAPP